MKTTAANTASRCRIVAFLLAMPVCGPLPAATPALPTPDEVFAIAVRPHAHQLTDYFTPESLRRALPHLKPVYVDVPIGGKIWWQSGVIVLKNGEVLFWRTYRDDILAIEINGHAYHFYAVRDPVAARSGGAGGRPGDEGQ